MSVDEDPRRPPWTRFQEALRSRGFRPSRRLGQNFLLDENLVRVIADLSGVGPEDSVLEVGPGCGFLSVHLAHRARRLVALELDTRLAEVAAEFLAPFPDAEVVQGDVLAGKNRLNPVLDERMGEGDWHLVSNLPYSVSSPVLALMAARERPPRTFTVLVQLEVAERLVARPGSADWGPLSVAVQLAYVPRLERRVPPGAFWPRPKVDSAVVHGVLRDPLAPSSERAVTQALARTLMQRRRQTLRRVLGDHLGDRERGLGVLEELGLDGGRRTSELGLEELAALAARCEPPGSGPPDGE